VIERDGLTTRHPWRDRGRVQGGQQIPPECVIPLQADHGGDPNST
jgi:hypothetical protein